MAEKYTTNTREDSSWVFVSSCELLVSSPSVSDCDGVLTFDALSWEEGAVSGAVWHAAILPASTQESKKAIHFFIVHSPLFFLDILFETVIIPGSFMIKQKGNDSKYLFYTSFHAYQA